MRITAERIIRNVLLKSSGKLAIHELGIRGHSDTALSARLREMARGGQVLGNFRTNAAFKEWGLTAQGRELAEREAAQYAPYTVA